MSKLAPLVILGVIVLGGGAVAYSVAKNNVKEDNNKPATTSQTNENKTESSAKFDDACKVVSKAAVESAFGISFKDGKAESDSLTSAGLPKKTCTFESVNDGSVTGLSNATNLTIAIENYGDETKAKRSIEDTKNSASFNGKVFFIRTDAGNIGDEAFFFQGQTEVILKTEEFMYARKGSQVIHFIAVRMSGIDHTAAKTAITKLASGALN